MHFVRVCHYIVFMLTKKTLNRPQQQLQRSSHERGKNIKAYINEVCEGSFKYKDFEKVKLL